LNLKVITYNIHKAIGVDRRFRPERIGQILQHYSADVVLLQEVDEGVPRSRELNLAKELAEALDYPYFALGHNVSLRRGRYGNATLSRFPILRERNIDLTLKESWIRRGCQHTTLELAEGSHLEVFNLHMGLAAGERRRQFELLVRSHEFSSVERKTPVLVGGDFNDWRSLLLPLFNNGLGFTCATERRSAGPYRCIPTYPSVAPQGGLDRVYFRGPLRLSSVYRCRLQIARLASDHLPIIAEFEVG